MATAPKTHLGIKISGDTLPPSRLALSSTIAQTRFPGPSSPYVSEALLSPPTSAPHRSHLTHTDDGWVTTPGSSSFGDATTSPFASPAGETDCFVVGTPGIEGRVTDGWRPRWLRRRVLGAFLSVFVVLAIAGEVVMDFVAKGETTTGVTGYWTFGPILVASILAALWSRVEFQSMQYTPWIILERGSGSVDETNRKQAAQTVLLDYPSMNVFQALSTAARYRHMLVVFSIFGTILLRAQIVLSTAVFYVDIRPDGSMILSIRTAVVHTMVGIFCAISLFTLPMLYHAPSKNGITPRSPLPIAGTAALLGNSRQFLSKLSDTGTSDMETVAAKVAGSWYTSMLQQSGKRQDRVFLLKQLTPGAMLTDDKNGSKRSNSARPYQPWSMGKVVQFFVIAACMAILAGLWAIFGIRGKGTGFERAEDLFALWTCLPTFVIVLLASLLSHVDLYTRRLTQFMKLATRNCRYKEALGLSYADEFALRTLIKSFRNKDWGVFLKKWMVIFAWTAPLFTAGLFSDVDLHRVKRLELRHETQFQSSSKLGNTVSDSELVDDILLRSTPRYPAWTYDNLAFPELDLLDDGKKWPSTNTVLVATIPALRSSMSCQTISIRDGADFDCEPLDSNFKTGKCKDNQTQIGFVASSCSKPSVKTPFNYVWGSCDEDGIITILKCNETLVEVNVQTTLDMDDLAIDKNAIPVPDRNSETPANLTLGVAGAYNILEDTGSDDKSLDTLDSFFRTLVLSRLSVPVARLVSEERINSVMQAVQLQHGIIRAQTLNSESVRRPFAADATNRPSPISASAKYSISRIKQSTMQTAVLTALLILIMIFSALALHVHQRCYLPKNPGSIAAQASLLSDSTVWWRLPNGAEWLTDKDLERRMRRRTFTMGWFDSGASGGGRSGISNRSYGVGIVQDQGKVVRVELEGDSSYPLPEFPMPPTMVRPDMNNDTPWNMYYKA